MENNCDTFNKCGLANANNLNATNRILFYATRPCWNPVNRLFNWKSNKTLNKYVHENGWSAPLPGVPRFPRRITEVTLPRPGSTSQLVEEGKIQCESVRTAPGRSAGVKLLRLKLIKQLGAPSMGSVAPMRRTVRRRNAAQLGRTLSTLMPAHAYERRSDLGH